MEKDTEMGPNQVIIQVVCKTAIATPEMEHPIEGKVRSMNHAVSTTRGSASLAIVVGTNTGVRTALSSGIL